MGKDILIEAHSNEFPIPNDKYYGTSFAPRGQENYTETV